MAETTRRVLGPGSEPDPRFTLANERTFLAWIRTGLALIAGAVAIEGFGINLDETIRGILAVLLIVLGATVAVGAGVRWLRVEQAMRQGRPLPFPPSSRSSSSPPCSRPSSCCCCAEVTMPDETTPRTDAGLQPERTSLAWQRTAISFVAVSLLTLRWTTEHGHVVAIVVMLAALIATWTFAHTRTRMRRIGRLFPAPGLEPATTEVLVVCTATATAALATARSGSRSRPDAADLTPQPPSALPRSGG